MANLTVAKADERQDGVLIDVPLAAVKVFKGANVSFNTSGYGKGSSDTASESYAGVAFETVDNSAGSAGDDSVRVYMEGVFSMNASSATQAWVGQDVYAVDDNVVALAATTTNDVKVGRVVKFVSASEVKVKI